MRSKIEWTDREQGWLEAIIDGEGSLALLHERRPWFKDDLTWKPTLSIANTSKELIERAKSLVNAGSISYRRPKNERYRALYQWQIHAETLRVLLPRIKLIAKEEHRVLLLEALDLLTLRKGSKLRYHPSADNGFDRLKEIHNKIRTLNG